MERVLLFYCIYSSSSSLKFSICKNDNVRSTFDYRSFLCLLSWY